MVIDYGVLFVLGPWDSEKKSSTVDDISNTFGKGSRALLKITSLCL